MLFRSRVATSQTYTAVRALCLRRTILSHLSHHPPLPASSASRSFSTTHRLQKPPPSLESVTDHAKAEDDGGVSVLRLGVTMIAAVGLVFALEHVRTAPDRRRELHLQLPPPAPPQPPKKPLWQL